MQNYKIDLMQKYQRDKPGGFLYMLIYNYPDMS